LRSRAPTAPCARAKLPRLRVRAPALTGGRSLIQRSAARADAVHGDVSQMRHVSAERRTVIHMPSHQSRTKRTAVQDAKTLQETARRRAQERAGRSGHNGAKAEAPPTGQAPLKAPTPKINKDWQKLLRPLTDTERELLRESIKASGVMVPILIDERGYIIDGMHRWQIAQELGEHCPRRMVEGLSEAQKLEQVLLLNAARRQMAGSEITAAAQALRLEGVQHPQDRRATGCLEGHRAPCNEGHRAEGARHRDGHEGPPATGHEAE